MSVTVTAVETSDALIEVNKSVAKGYVDALRSANEELGLTDDLTLSKLIRLPDIFSVRKTAEDEEVIWNDVKTVADKASDCFIKMRETEGEKMKEDVLERADAIEEMVFEIERLSPISAESYRNKLYARLCEVLADKNIDEQRIVTEAAILQIRLPLQRRLSA